MIRGPRLYQQAKQCPTRVDECMISIDRKHGLPVYLQIKHQVLHDISMGRLPAGHVLPSIRQLSRQLGIAPATVRHAYAVLEDEGVVTSHQGKGVVVAELAPVPGAETVRRQQALIDLLRPALVRARSLGYAPNEVQSAVALALAEADGAPKVIFVGGEPEFIEYYTPLITDGLRDLGVDVAPMPVRWLEEMGSAGLVTLPVCVMTLVRSYAKVREALRDVPVPIIALALDLSDETTSAFINLPRTARTVLAAERINLTGFAHLLEQYVAAEEPPVSVATEAPDLADKLARADVVIHSLRARQKVRRLAPPGCQLVELHFVPNPTSLARVRETIQRRIEEGAEAGDSADRRELVGVGNG
jgi:DNA-binding transcriptional regulator YhcF (GntR family)